MKAGETISCNVMAARLPAFLCKRYKSDNIKYFSMEGGYKMKDKRIIFISLLLLLISLMCLFVFAEKEVLPILTWDRTYGGSGDDWAWPLIQTTDGGYAVAGVTTSKGAGGADFWVIKLDEQGKKVWDKTYGGSGADLALPLIQTTDGGYVVAGRTESKGSGGKDFWIIKLDEQGNEVWDRTYGGGGNDEATSFIQTTDGGYAVAGSTTSKGAGNLDFWVIKLDNQGNRVWDKTYGGSGDDAAWLLIQTTDGGYAVAGGTYSKGAGGADFWVIKLDKQGNEIWDRTYGGSGLDVATSLIQTTDGGYAVAGGTYSKGAGKEDFWVIKLDEQGNEIWDRTYGGSGNDGSWTLIQTTDGGYAVAGWTSSKGAGGADFWVIKLDEQGNEIWDRTYGGSGDDGATSLIQTTDGGYAVAGGTYSKGAGKEDFWVIKLDEKGNLK
jgi:predicted secreted protein